MIVLSPGHSHNHPGAVIGGHSEHAEACLWVGMLAAQLDACSVITGTSQRKTAMIEELRPRVAIEWHFGTNHTDSTSGVVALSPKRGCLHSLALALALEQALPTARLMPGWYRGDETKGEDFFLRVAAPAILITVDQFDNLDHARKRQVAILQAIVDQLRQAPPDCNSGIR